MKKSFVICLMLILSFGLFTSVFADAEFTITDKTLIIYDDDDDGYFFARAENTGDAGGFIGSGTLTILDESGEVMIEKKYIGTSPSSIYLEPGEHAYFKYSIWEKILLEKKPGDFDFVPTLQNYGKHYHVIPCDVELYYPGKESYDNSIFVTFTNTGDDILHNFEIVAAVYDPSDTLIYTAGRQFNDIAVHPGSTITIMLTYNNKNVEYQDNHEIIPSRIEAITYVED